LLWAITSSFETEVHELVEARKLIETELAGMAAERATVEDLSQIGNQLDRMESAIQRPSEFLQADIEFHLAVAQAAHNTILMNALHLIRNLLQEWMGSSLQIDGIAQKALDQHKAIFLAIAKKNDVAARAAMASHLAEMARPFVKAQELRETNAAQTANTSVLDTEASKLI
jgi:GntR family transcriptional repressor for pyruvate dehydrogenase complex